MNAPANSAAGVIPLSRQQWTWLDLDSFDTHLTQMPAVHTALDQLGVGGPVLDRDGMQRAWRWLSGLLDSPWGLTGHVHRLDDLDEAELLKVLGFTAKLCSSAGHGNMPSATYWHQACEAAEAAPVRAQGGLRWALFHALTAAHVIADEASWRNVPAGRVAVVEAFTALIGTVTGEDQRRSVIHDAVTAWTIPTHSGGAE
ncbi:hypothetical protein AB0N05_37565 [Nocardia sp. NPDC051030]|uniref:hypothetical protein n=1 Tax=Nocardia sp. NPDC051030 TaxID=3155162 RepID=UPI003446292B